LLIPKVLLGMVNLIASYRAKSWIWRTSNLVLVERLPCCTASGQAIINQMFAYYKFSDAVTNMGQIQRSLDEVISPISISTTTFTFSRGTFQPYGVRAFHVWEWF
jgi:hypothetical protein